MEEPGPEAKRPRLDTTYNAGSHRSHQHSIAPSHSYPPHVLPPRNAYPSAAPPPPSPYYEAGAHEHDRALPPPSSAHANYTSHSGHSTPVREQRHYAPDPSYSRRGSASAPTRSPEGNYQQYPGGRPLNCADGYYQSSYASDSANHAVGYPNADGTMNGHTHGLPMPTYPESTPAPTGRPSDYGQSPVNVAPSGYPASAYGTPTTYGLGPRFRKGNRATQACDVCRQRKAKCDEGRPKCSHCVENGLQCNYQTVAPAKADRANQAIMEHLAAQDRKIDTFEGKMEGKMANFENMVAPLPGLQSSIDRIEKFLLNSASPRVSSTSALESNERRSSLGRQIESPKRRVTPDQKVLSTTLSHISFAREPVTRETKVEASPSGSYATASTEPGSEPNVPNTTVNVPVEHTTAAHRLLAWPPITKLFKLDTLQGFKPDDEYVMRLEEESGVLRVYGRGEGRGKRDRSKIDSRQQSASSPAPTMSSGRSDESPDPSSPDGIWGSGFITPVTSPTMSHASSEPSFDFSLNIHPRTLRRLLDSYLNNLHILHPFLDKSGLTRMVKRFSMRYNPDEQKLNNTLFLPTGANANLDALRGVHNNCNKAGKRYRHEGYSINSVTESDSTQGQQKRDIPMFERSIQTAIVLLVMALGKICEWKQPLPGVRTLNEQSSSNETGLHHPSPTRGNIQSPPSLSHKTSPASPSSNVLGSTADRSPMTMYPSPKSSPDESCLRNVDLIPGLSYYAPATDILGNLYGSNDLFYVQAYLLAGLFMGQLARTFESFNWIASACRGCRFLVRDPSLQRETEPRKTQIMFAFWTCSQLESDILAELDLPRSGIQELREVQYPTGYIEPTEYSTWESSETQIMGYYSGQIHIRNQLNDIQKDLYAPENLERATRGFKLRDVLNENLEYWRKCVPPTIQWNDTDEPAAHINAARLRAKYYGARYIIHRPFLRYALENDIFSNTASSGSMGPSLSIGPFEKAQIEKSCKICVEAAIRSTIAFDRVMDKERLIVTNIFGTAHAQFGNMLVLSATYKSTSPTLSSLITRKQLEELFDRTISFLGRLIPLSESLEQDVRILEALRKVLFESSKVQGSSFSSVDSK